MISKVFLPALAAIGVAAMPQSSSNDGCTAETFTINANADLTKLSSCTTLKGNVVIGTDTDSKIDFGMIRKVDGNVDVKNNGKLQSLSGQSLSEITGTWTLQNLTQLTSLNFQNLISVKEIAMQSLTAIDHLTFSKGIQKCDKVVVSDTHLSTLKGLDMTTTNVLNINNNFLLVEYSSSLSNISDTLEITANGLNFKLSFPNMASAVNMSVANVSTFDAPSLETVNGSMRFDSNYFTSFAAPNLTEVSADISFISNGKLTNISFPALTAVGGGFTVANNTGLQKIDGFPQLKTVGGAVKLRGNFSEINLGSLSNVRGTFDTQSTNDISGSCSTLEKLAPQSQGGGGQIEGEFTCKSNNADANSDTSTGGSGGGSNNSDKNAAGIMGANMISVLGVTLIGVVFQALL